MYENDNLGTLADIVAGPFAGAFLHSREHYEELEKLKHIGGPLVGIGETPHMMKGPPNSVGVPWGCMVEAGLSGADALNQGVHGDWGGAASTLAHGICDANGGLPSLFSHWVG